jgi:hypothetical protein
MREFHFATQAEASAAAIVLSESQERPWRVTPWADGRWGVIRETSENEVVWLPAGSGDVADWVQTGINHMFDHLDDVLPETEEGTDMVDWRNARMELQSVVATCAGDVATIKLTVGSEFLRTFRIEIQQA